MTHNNRKAKTSKKRKTTKKNSKNNKHPLFGMFGLQPMIPMMKSDLCRRPGCQQTYIDHGTRWPAKPKRLSGVRIARRIFCAEHNPCFHCKRPGSTYHRICMECAERSMKKKYSRIAKNKLPSLGHAEKTFIMAASGCPSDVVKLLAEQLKTIDILMWAVACGMKFKPRARYVDLAVKNKSFAQFEWLLKYGCPDQRHRQNIKFITAEIGTLAETREFEEVRLSLVKPELFRFLREYFLTMRHRHDAWLELSNKDLDLAYAYGDFEFMEWCFKRVRVPHASKDILLNFLVPEEKIETMEWMVAHQIPFANLKGVIPYALNKNKAVAFFRRAFVVEFGLVLQNELDEAAKDEDYKKLRQLGSFLEPGDSRPKLFTAVFHAVNTGHYTEDYLVFKVARELGCQPNISDIDALIKQGAVSTLKILKKLGFDTPLREEALAQAVSTYSSKMVECLYDLGAAITPNSLINMVTTQQLDMVEWAVSKGAVLTKDLHEASLIYRRQEVQEWLEEHGCPF